MWIGITSRDRSIQVMEGVPNYPQMRDWIEGFIEPVDLYHYPDGRRITLYGNEEGLLDDLKQSVIVRGVYPDNSGMRGNVLIVATDPMGETVALTQREVDAISLKKAHYPLTVLHSGSEVVEIGEFPVVPTLVVDVKALKEEA
jgi:hypothetical protein